MVGAIALHEEDGRLVAHTRHLLKRRHQDKKTGALTVFNDARDMEVVSENVQGLAHAHFFGLGVDVVDQDVVRPLEIVSGVKKKNPRDKPKNPRGKPKKT